MVTNNMMSGGHDQMRSTRPKRANAKSQAPKKPQRGLGVAQLERIRIQEGLNKMTGMTQEFSILNSALEPSPAMGGGGINVPLACSTPGYSAPAPSPAPYHHQLIGSGGSGFFPPTTGIRRGLEGMPRSANYGGGGYFGNIPIDHGDVVLGRVVSSPFGVVGGSDFRMVHHHQQGGACNFDAPRELSSGTNGHSLVDPCEFCIKKKRIDEQNMDFNRSLRNLVSYPETTNTHNIGRDYIGLGHTQQQSHFFPSNNGLNLSARDSTSAFKTYRNPNQVVEVEGFQKKMNYNGNSNPSREHEFFPGKNGRSTLSEGQVFPAVGLVALDPEEASNSIDLTLKL